jgi:lysophospholipase L1-like esterase
MMGIGSMLKNIFIGLALTLVSVLLVLLVCEVVVRFVFPTLKPSSRYDWSARHKGYPLSRSPNTFRIVVLGDSYTFGQGVEKDKTFPAALERLLNGMGANVKFEVVNLGFCGLNTMIEKQILSEYGINPDTWSPDPDYRGLAYQPDLVIVQYTLNDSSTSWRNPGQVKSFDDRFRTGEVVLRVNSGRYSLPLPDGVDKFFTMHSRLYLAVFSGYNQLLGMLGLREAGKGAIDATLSRYQDNFDGWIWMNQALQEMSAIGRNTGTPVVMAIYPDMVRLSSYPFVSAHKKVKSAAESYGIPTLDLLPYFQGKNEKELIATPFDAHPNAKAHAIAAQAILEFLTANRFFLNNRGR